MEKVDFKLEKKVAVITGGSQGIGLEYAKTLSGFGASIGIADIQDEKAKEVADSIAKEYRNTTLAVHMDVSDRVSINKGAEEILAKFGKVDILINNAGIIIRKKFEDVEDREWDQVIDVNLRGTFLCSQVFGRPMIQQKSGKIINISSVAAFLGMEERISYGVSKSGVAHLTRMLAYEWAKYNINVNAIAPGTIITEFNRAYLSQPDVREEFLEMIPLKRFGEPIDLCGLVVFLASEASDYVTGQVFFVDGGRMLY